MKGQGQLGPLLTMMGMKPVKFQSESDFAKGITTESKVFSIYATGVAEGTRRRHAKGSASSACWQVGGACARIDTPCYRPAPVQDCVPEGYMCCLDKDETQVHEHMVVDFRQAPALVGGSPGGGTTAPPGGSSTSRQPSTPPPGTQGAGTADPNGNLAASNQTSTGGQVLYFKME